MKKLLLLICLISSTLYAQQIEIKSIKRLQGTESGGHYHPIFSPKSSWILTSSENYTGLQKISLQNNEKIVLTKEAGAGYDVNISKDESEILYKKTEFVNNVRYTSLYKHSFAANKTEKVENATREQITSFFEGNKALYVKGEKLVKDNKMLKSSAVGENVPFINIENQKMSLYNGSTKKILTPNGVNASYFWASVSPDQKHIVYTVAAKGTFVCNIDGSNVKSLGKLNAPVWMNNNWIVGMYDKDNGSFVISSEIVATTIDGKVRQTLKTPQTEIAMYPSASADGKRIAYNTDKGEIYLIDINIK
jgi:Tol biopolymer transport system component